MTRQSILFLFAALGTVSWAGEAKGQSCAAAPFSVGYRVATFGSLKAGIWFPTSGVEQPFPYISGLSGSVALNGAPLGCARFPLVVFSHAYGGCGTQSVFFTEELARRGYIVAAPDHRDALCSVDGTSSQTLAPTQESFLDPSSWTDATYADRKELTIDSILKDATLGSSVDSSRIAVAGHSLGGYTAFGIAGGWSTWKDSRVRAALLFSPYILPFQSHNTVSQVAIPVMYQSAQFHIGITPFPLGGHGACAASQPPKFLAELMGGTHFDWTVLVCGSQPTIAACLHSAANAQTIDNYGFAFLDHALKAADAPILFSNGPGVADYQRTTLLTSVSAASLTPGAAPQSIVTGFGEGLASSQAVPNGSALPASLAGVSVMVTDSKATSRPASLFFLSPSQVNILIPDGTATGAATIDVHSGNAIIASGTAAITAVAPALFSADATGSGIAAAESVSANPDGTQQVNLIFDPPTLSPVPISLDKPVYLVLYGTGLRGHQSPVEVSIGGMPVPVTGLAPQSQFAGLDQLNVGPLPTALGGSGTKTISVTVDGHAANSVSVVFR